MVDLYSNVLYLENVRLHEENIALKEVLAAIKDKERPFIEALTNPDSVKIIQAERGFIFEISLKNSEFDNFRIFCSNIVFETEKNDEGYFVRGENA